MVAASCVVAIVVRPTIAGAAVVPEGVSRASAPLGCSVAKSLLGAVERPVWFPFPQPVGHVLQVNGPPGKPLESSQQGLKWDGGGRYFWLDRIDRTAADAVLFEFGSIHPDLVATESFNNIGRQIKIWRWGDFLYAEWPTIGRPVGLADTTRLAAEGETRAEFVAFLRSLRTIRWPACCP